MVVVRLECSTHVLRFKVYLKLKYEMRLFPFYLEGLCEQFCKQSVRGNPVCVYENVFKLSEFKAAFLA